MNITERDRGMRVKSVSKRIILTMNYRITAQLRGWRGNEEIER